MNNVEGKTGKENVLRQYSSPTNLKWSGCWLVPCTAYLAIYSTLKCLISTVLQLTTELNEDWMTSSRITRLANISSSISLYPNRHSTYITHNWSWHETCRENVVFWRNKWCRILFELKLIMVTMSWRKTWFTDKLKPAETVIRNDQKYQSYMC